MHKHSILIVDDEKNLSKLLSKVLIREGYGALTADSGIEALNIFESQQVDIIITDIKMPGMDGMELLRRIKTIDPSIKVIMITAFATLETAIEALRIGAADYITKPFNIDEVVYSVRRIVESSEEIEPLNQGIKNKDKSIENYLISKSPAMAKVLELIKQVADTKATIMLYGETGTGKELAAQALHSLSSRWDKPLIKVNCAAIPEQLLESELFGFEKGAFTGAVSRKPGRFELASGGTIFLDEIGDITAAMQVKLMRVLQEREFEHLGGTKTVKVDVRVITATNKNIEELVKKGLFREELYYRLNVVPITLPPLRERKGDIPVLIHHFLDNSSVISGRYEKQISEDAIQKMIEYNWPGNIRELENIIERCVVITPGDLIKIDDLPVNIINYSALDKIEGGFGLDNVVDNAEKDAIIDAIRKCRGNRTKASELLGISRRSLHRKINKYSIED